MINLCTKNYGFRPELSDLFINVSEVHCFGPPGMLSDRSRSLNVIHFYICSKPIYDFLLMINCDLGSILHRFQDISLAPRIWRKKSPSSGLSSPIAGTHFEFSRKNYHAKNGDP